MIYEPSIECATKEQMLAIQAGRFRNALNNGAFNCSAYLKLLEQAGIIGNIAKFSDEELIKRLENVDFTDQKIFRTINQEMLEKIDKKLYLVDQSSASTGTPKKVFMTLNDDLNDKKIITRMAHSFNLTEQDRVLTFDIGFVLFYTEFTKAFENLGIKNSFFYCARKDFNQSMKEALQCEPTMLITVPSVLMRAKEAFCEYLEKNPSIKKIAYYGERINKNFENQLKSVFGIECFSIYGSTEVGWLGTECEHHEGVHLYTDRVFPHLKYPRKEEENRFNLENVVQTEIAFTTLDRTGKTALAYLIGDEVEYTSEPCKCGRTLPRINFIQRKKEIVNIHGTKFTFKEVYNLIYSDEQTGFIQIALDNSEERTRITIRLPEYLMERNEEITRRLKNNDSFKYYIDHDVLDLRTQYVPAGFFTKRKIKPIDDKRGFLGDYEHNFLPFAVRTLQ